MNSDWLMLRQSLDQVMIRDVHRFGRQLHALEKSARAGKNVEQQLQALHQQISTSQALVNQRQQTVPTEIHFPDLPVCEKRAEIAQLINANQVIVLAGETGSGKT